MRYHRHSICRKQLSLLGMENEGKKLELLKLKNKKLLKSWRKDLWSWNSHIWGGTAAWLVLGSLSLEKGRDTTPVASVLQANTGIPEEGVMRWPPLRLECSCCLGKKPRLLRWTVWLGDAHRHGEQKGSPQAANRKEQGSPFFLFQPCSLPLVPPNGRAGQKEMSLQSLSSCFLTEYRRIA